MSRNGRHALMEVNGRLDEALAVLAARYQQARQSGSGLDLLSVMAEAQLLQLQVQMRILADNQDMLMLSGWSPIPAQMRQVSVGTGASLVVDLEHGERTVVDLYVFDPSGASPNGAAFGGPGVTFNQGYIVPPGIVSPPLALTESLYAVAETGSVTICVRRRG